MPATIDRTEVPLVVILGAGASRGAGDAWGNLRPPLTVDLFDEDDYGHLLQEYDLAHQAGRYIADECAGGDALSIEQVLHSLRHSEHVHHRRMAYSVPPYLQHLLHSVSEAHYRHVYRYDRLIERLLRLPYVCFMTLNYDVLLDRRLAAHHPLNDFEHYISEDKNWSLIKLHGSVNWVYEVPYPLDPYPPTEELQIGDHDLRCFHLKQTWRRSEVFSVSATAIPPWPSPRVRKTGLCCHRAMRRGSPTDLERLQT